MNVKGIIYLTGKNTIIAAFGEERWNSFVPKLAAKDKFFSNTIWAITSIPMDNFILYLDELVKEFFDNDKMQYVTFGKVAAQFALSPEGPYKSYLLTKDTKQFAEFVLPKLWSTYFDEGKAIAKFENKIVHLKITGLQIKHSYFEKLLMGYFQKALKIFGKKTVAKQVRSLASGDDDIYFQYELKDS
ncbi:MAG: hypothetical protein ABSC11_14160 [Smithella sp.]|jgi:hypothetical protein